MSSEKMESVNKKHINGMYEDEHNISNYILHTKIQNIFNLYNYNILKLKTIFESGIITEIDKAILNETLWDIKYIHNINFIDILEYILKFSDSKKIMKIINNELMSEIKLEFLKNNIRLKQLTNETIDE